MACVEAAPASGISPANSGKPAQLCRNFLIEFNVIKVINSIMVTSTWFEHFFFYNFLMQISSNLLYRCLGFF